MIVSREGVISGSVSHPPTVYIIYGDMVSKWRMLKSENGSTETKVQPTMWPLCSRYSLDSGTDVSVVIVSRQESSPMAQPVYSRDTKKESP